MNNIINRSSKKIVREQFEVYGEYVNLHRQIPYVFDGLKPSYRRLILSAIELAPNKLVKSATLIGHTIGHYHPHGDMSIEPIVAELVHAGVFTGQGNFGKQMLYNEDAVPAKPRYTEAGMSAGFMELFAPVLKYIPKFSNDLGYEEYEYLPTPIPLGMLNGYLGIGVGTGCRIPAFTPESILNAYINDDPTLLVNDVGLNITNREKLIDIWRMGRGQIKYSIDTRYENGQVIIEGNRGPLSPNYAWFNELKRSGNIIINDYSSGNSCKLVIEKAPRVRYPEPQLIYEKALSIMKGQESYYVRCVYNDQVRDLGLYDWIDITYQNYMKLYERYLKDEIVHLKHQIDVFSHFREVADLIINKTDSYEQIAKNLGIDVSIVNEISTKSLNTLRKSDPKSKIASLEEKIKSLSKTDVCKVIKDNIESL